MTQQQTVKVQLVKSPIGTRAVGSESGSEALTMAKPVAVEIPSVLVTEI